MCEERPAAYLGHLVAAVAYSFLVLLYLLSYAKVFGPESTVAWQFVYGELADGHLGVYLVGDDDLLALIRVALAYGGSREEGLLVNLRRRLWLLCPGVVGTALLALLLTLLLLCGAHLDDLYGEAF